MIENLIANIERVNSVVNSFIWGPPMLIFFLAVGIYFTIGTKFFHIKKFGFIMKNTIFAVFRDKDVVKTKDKKAISQFQSAATSLAATIGTGNIVGVATAIAAGGAGAIFWMWVSALLGMITSYSENVLGIYFRHKNLKGEWVGGPMQYIEKGLKTKWLAIIFASFCFIASFGIGSIVQVNGISTALKSSYNVPTYITGITVCVLVSIIILGGLKRIVGVTEKLVPAMATFYIFGTIIIILVNYQNIGTAVSEIFTSAFNLKSVGSGVMGYGITRAMRFGIARGVFTNEAGLGSSVMVHCSSDVKEPVLQGMWSVFEVFFDTIVMCSLTAIAILVTGADKVTGLEGVGITLYAFSKVFGTSGEYILTISLVLFAFSTILGWSVYGGRAAEYLGGERFVGYYKILFLFSIFIGSVSSIKLVWDLSDTFNGLMAIPNLISILLLSKIVFNITNNYKERIFKKKKIEPMLSFHKNNR